MDTVDAPYYSQKKAKPRYDPMQNELKARLAQRRRDGLTHELTSEESDNIIEDDDDGEDDDDLSKYRVDPSSHIRRDRPTSAKRRSQFSSSFENEHTLNETVRPGARKDQTGSDRFLKKDRKGGGDSMPLLSPTSPKISPKDRYNSDRFSPKDKSFTDKLSPKERSYGDRLFGKDKSMDTMRHGDGESYMKDRKSPYGEGLAALPKAQGASPRTKSGKSSPLTNEEMIFGRKTPDHMRKSPVESGKWQPPQYRKTSPVQEEGRDTSPGAKGRRTPQDSLLAPIDEKPSPRFRKQSGGDRSKVKESPRTLNLNESSSSDQPKPRPRPKTDIFGKTQKVEVDLDDELEEINRSPGRYSRSSPVGKKSPTGFRQGRQTPTEISQGRPGSGSGSGSRYGRKTPTGSLQGRHTPTRRMEDRQSPTGRKTPTGKMDGRQSPGSKYSGRKTPVDEKKEKFAQNREPSLMDFLAGDASPAKPEKKQSEKSERLLKKKDTTLDFLGEEMTKPDIHIEPKARPRKYHHELSDDHEQEIPDESSVCEELDREPIHERTEKTEEKSKKTSKNRQTAENQMFDTAIKSVAGEQSKPLTQVKHIDPDKVKKDGKVKVHKPKPRHSLPGTPAGSTSDVSEPMFEDTKSIRQAIYDEWKKERLREARKKLAEEKKKEEEEKRKKEEEKAEKEVERKASYNAWVENKKPVLQQKAHQKRIEEEKKEKEEKEKEQKKKDALKDFSKWKESKDAQIIEERRRKAREEERKKYEEEQLKKKKEKENATALRGWNNKKEKIIKNNETLKKTMMKQTVKQQEDHKKKQEMEALKLYDDWLKKKEKQKKKEKRMRYGSQEDIDFRPPWSPANKTIPTGR